MALGGALGASARVALPWPTMLDDSLAAIDPLPTVLINVIGAALLGLVTGYSAQRQWPEPVLKGITTGFLGAFTTMSALAVASTGLLLWQTVFVATSIGESLVVVASIVVVLLGLLVLTTALTIGTVKLGRRLAGGES